MERDGRSKNILYRPKRLKISMQTRIKTKKSRKSNPLPFIWHFSLKRYPFRIPSISKRIEIPKCAHKNLTIIIIIIIIIIIVTNGALSTYLVQNFVSLLTAVNQCTVLHRNQSQKQPVTPSIGSGQTEFLVSQRNQLVFKPVFLKQFHFLKPLDIFMTLLKQAKKVRVREKVTLRDANEDVDKVCIEVRKTSDNAVGNPTGSFSLHLTQNIQYFELQDFGNRVKESLKITTNSKWATFTESRIVPCQILSCLCQHSRLRLRLLAVRLFS